MVAHNAHVQRFVHEAWKVVNKLLCAARNRCFTATDRGIAGSGPPVNRKRAAGVDALHKSANPGNLFVSKRTKLAPDGFMECGDVLGPIHDPG
jgi:hypothetical protein